MCVCVCVWLQNVFHSLQQEPQRGSLSALAGIYMSEDGCNPTHECCTQQTALELEGQEAVSPPASCPCPTLLWIFTASMRGFLKLCVCFAWKDFIWWSGPWREKFENHCHVPSAGNHGNADDVITFCICFFCHHGKTRSWRYINISGSATKAVLSASAGVYVTADRFSRILAAGSHRPWQVCSWHQNEHSFASQLVSFTRKMVSGSFRFSLLFFC